MNSLLALASAATVVASAGYASAQGSSSLDKIAAIAAGSTCESVNWPNRGRAPKSYIRGVAIVFAKAVCQSDRSDVKVVSAAPQQPGTAADKSDAMTWYDAIFHQAGMSNTQNGLDTLRHAYTLLIGLGMRESSGKYCVGRDRSADFSSANTAEAGVFQTSWGAHVHSPTLDELFTRYSADQSGCLLDTFRQHVSCSRWDAKNWGDDGETGKQWQILTKQCPAFATEYGAVVLRTHGGSKGEFGPIRKKAASVRKECDSMLSKVQALVQSDPGICASFK